MNHSEIKESLESLCPWVSVSSIVDYLETCVCENFDINGTSVVKFNNLQELIETYLDEIRINKRDFDNILFEAKYNNTIMKLVINRYSV